MSSDDANRLWWDERARFHRRTPLYQGFIERLRAGHGALLPIERRELGDVDGLKVLHLQCHIGTDTLSLAGLGAEVTGLDFSPAALEEARRLASELSVPALFLEGDVRDAPRVAGTDYDLVFASYGVLGWLPSLGPWFRAAADCLKPGGRVYVIDGHPAAAALDEREAGRLVVQYPMVGSHPIVEDLPGSYADREAPTTHNRNTTYTHGLSDVVNAVVAAGLKIEYLNEHAEGFCPGLPGMEEGSDHLWRLPEALHGRVPLTFSVSAHKPDG